MENNDGISSENLDLAWQKASMFSSLQHEPLLIEKAGYWRRFFAYSIDWWIIGIINTFISLFAGGEGVSPWWTIISIGLGILIPGFYFAWPYSRGGQTLGKRILGIRVVSINGSPLTWRNGIIRTFGYIPSTFVLYIGFLWAIFDGDKQAWQDKMAGTIVIRGSYSNEQLQDYIEPEEAGRRQKRWLLVLGIPTISIMLAGGIAWAIFIQGGMSQVHEMGDWPGAEVSPEQVIDVDLSHLGLELAQIIDSRDDEAWEYGQYASGVLVSFKSGTKDAVYIWALRYEDTSIARADFDSLAAWAEQDCRYYTWRILDSSGIIDCGYTDAYNKMLLNEHWILDILAFEGAGFTPNDLVDQVVASIADHWDDSPKFQAADS